jgi:hypothetical protein
VVTVLLSDWLEENNPTLILLQIIFSPLRFVLTVRFSPKCRGNDQQNPQKREDTFFCSEKYVDLIRKIIRAIHLIKIVVERSKHSVRDQNIKRVRDYQCG